MHWQCRLNCLFAFEASHFSILRRNWLQRCTTILTCCFPQSAFQNEILPYNLQKVGGLESPHFGRQFFARLSARHSVKEGFITVWLFSLCFFSKLFGNKYPNPECLRIKLYQDVIQVNIAKSYDSFTNSTLVYWLPWIAVMNDVGMYAIFATHSGVRRLYLFRCVVIIKRHLQFNVCNRSLAGYKINSV